MEQLLLMLAIKTVSNTLEAILHINKRILISSALEAEQQFMASVGLASVF
jgi:hypothetical protein